MRHATLALALALLASVSAHPGEDHAAEALERRAALETLSHRSLSHCHAQLAARGVHARNAVRRRALLEGHQLYKRHGKRDLASVLAKSHKSSLTGVTAATNSSTLFAGAHQCILAPEVTEGPYYITGEYFRKNVTDGEAGVPMIVDLQIIDTSTCEPLPGVALDFWHCNATGVYSGVVAGGNGNGRSDDSNIYKTFCRGIQQSDAEGVVKFETIFPGHYSGRATHIHILAHAPGEWQLLNNNTISGGDTTAHIGQVYFDQDLITQVTTVEPYASNTQRLTTNANDNIMAAGAASDVDPVVEYVLLGDSVSDGIFAWISVGIDASASRRVKVAAQYAGSPSGSGGSGTQGAGSSGSGVAGASGSAASTGAPASWAKALAAPVALVALFALPLGLL